MGQFIRFTLGIVFCIIVSVITSPSAQAASGQAAPAQTTMKVKVSIDQPDIFWNYTFLTKDTTLGKPATVKLVWSVGEVPKSEKTEVVVNTGKTAGQLDISTEKKALVNINAIVYDSKNNKLGVINLQIQNNGQTENITISPPEFTEPKIIWSNA